MILMGVRDVARDFRPYVAVLVAATDPRAGWTAFGGAVLTSFTGVAMLPLLGTAFLELWLGRGFWTDLILELAMWLFCTFVSVLVEIRLYRLLAPPSTPSWVRCGVVALPLAAASLSFWSVNRVLRSVPGAATSDGSTWLAIIVLGLVAALCYAVAAWILGRRP
jgi:hypothetical protein